MATKPELPDLPALEAPADEHLNFANQALRRRWNLIARIRKYGTAAPMLVLVFERGDELALTAGQHRYGAGLIDQLASFDGQLCPGYTIPQLRVIYAALIRAADVWETDTERDELLGDLNALLVRCLLTNDQPPLIRPDEQDKEPKIAMYRAIADFQTINRKRSGHPAEPLPILLFWHHIPDWHGDRPVELWVPRRALQAWLRAMRNWKSGPALRNTLLYFGWQQRHLQARSPSDWRRRVHAHAWVVPVPWPDCEVDLTAAAAQGTLGDAGGRVPTSPGGTHSYTRAEEVPRARTRTPGDAWGRWTGPGGTLKPTKEDAHRE